MGIVRWQWFKRKIVNVKPTREDLEKELGIVEYQIEACMAIAKANPGHDVLWDNVHRNVEESNLIRREIRELEGRIYEEEQDALDR